jgi:hypothetical protein
MEEVLKHNKHFTYPELYQSVNRKSTMRVPRKTFARGGSLVDSVSRTDSSSQLWAS